MLELLSQNLWFPLPDSKLSQEIDTKKNLQQNTPPKPQTKKTSQQSHPFSSALFLSTLVTFKGFHCEQETSV